MHEVDEGDPNLPLGTETGLPFKLYMPFMVTKLVRLFTVSFMVDSLVWRPPMFFIVGSVQSHGSVFGESEVSTNRETRHPTEVPEWLPYPRDRTPWR